MHQNTTYICILDIAKFPVKNADVSRTQGVCQVIYIFSGSSWVKYNCVKFHHCRICMTDFREGGPHP